MSVSLLFLECRMVVNGYEQAQYLSRSHGCLCLLMIFFILLIQNNFIYHILFHLSQIGSLLNFWAIFIFEVVFIFEIVFIFEFIFIFGVIIILGVLFIFGVFSILGDFYWYLGAYPFPSKRVAPSDKNHGNKSTFLLLFPFLG